MDIWTLIERAAALHPRRIGLVDLGERITYAELRARSAALASFLRTRGIAPGDRVSILAWNGEAFFETYFAAAGVGAILNPLNVRQSPRELAAILSDCGSRWLIADASLGELAGLALSEETAIEGVLWSGATVPSGLPVPSFGFEAAARSSCTGFEPVTRHPDDVAQLYYTSGTTGHPKGVMLTHRNVCVHALGAIAELGLSECDRWAHIAPMFHLADAWATFAITWVGGTHVMMPRFEAVAALDLLERERITLTNLVPTMLNLMVKHPTASGRDWSSLRMLLSGGAPIAPEVVRAIVDTFRCEYVQTYGMTETSPYLTLSLLKEHLRALPPEQQLVWRAKTGRPFVAVELEVVDESGARVASDERTVGEIRVRGETVTPGYWGRPAETREAFRDGWLMTGDLAVVDAEGFVTIVDRKKDVILTGGEKVYSVEVENVLYEHPAVLEAAVFGRNDPVWGEIVCAAVVLRTESKSAREELTSLCRRRLAGYKVPKSFEFLCTLPRSGSGKIVKRLLRDAEAPSPSAHA